MSTAVSPLAPTDVPDMPDIAGVRLATAAAGIRYKGRTDVLLAVLDKGTTVAGVFTRSKCPSAPVEWCRAKLGVGSSKAGSGPRAGGEFRQRQRLHRQDRAAGHDADGRDRRQGARLQRRSEVFLASTGVIGEPLDASKFDGVLGTLAAQAAPGDWMSAARAIMTTDTFPKVATATVKLGKAKVTINGMAKGAGMIAPDMATMLAFVFTDAPIARRRAAIAAEERRRRHLQRRHHRRRHLDLRHLAGVRHRGCGRRRRAEDQPRRRSRG